MSPISEKSDFGKLQQNVGDQLEKVFLELDKALLKSEAQKEEVVFFWSEQKEKLKIELEQSETQKKELKKELEQSEAQREELKKELEQSEAQREELKNKLKQSKAQKKDLKKELEQSEAQKKELKKELEQSEARKKELKQELKQSKAKKKDLKKELEQSEAQKKEQSKTQKKDLKKELEQSEARKKELRYELEQREIQLQQMNKWVTLEKKQVDVWMPWLAQERKSERFTLKENEDDGWVAFFAEEQKDAYQSVPLLAEERMQWQREKVELQSKSLELKKQFVVNLQHMDELEVKTNEIQEKLKEMEEELADTKALNRVLIVKEHEHNAELHEARNKLIIGLSQSSSGTCIGVKRMGELDIKPFRTAIKRQNSKRVAHPDDKAMELCSLWEVHLRDPSWQPFKIIMDVKGTPMEVIDEEDGKLKSLKMEFGEEVFGAVTTALAELNECNPSGRYPVQELWNFKEERKASLAEGISHLLNLWKPIKRIRRSSQMQNDPFWR